MSTTTALTPVEVLSNLAGYQIEALLSEAKVRVLLNSRQSGKTSTLRSIIYKEGLQQPTDILVFGVTHRSVKYNLWKPLFEGSDPIYPRHLIKTMNRTDMFVELLNGTTIRCSGLENVDAILGATADLAIFDEAQSLSEDAINKIQPMLSTRDGNMILAGTVRTRTNILWKYYEKGQLDHPDYTPGFRSWRVTVYDSPTPNNNPDMIQFLKSSMSLSQFKAEFECDPDSGQGRVIPDYDSTLNRSDKTLNVDKPLYIGIDFNVKPYTAVIHQVYDNDIHAIEELYINDTNTHKVAELIKNKYQQWENRIFIYPDATGTARKTSSKNSDITILSKVGKIVVNRSNPLQSNRINAFNAQVCTATGTRHYFVHPNCKHLIESLLGLIYDDNGKMDKKAGLDHIFDATSYFIAKAYPIKSTRIVQQHF